MDNGLKEVFAIDAEARRIERARVREELEGRLRGLAQVATIDGWGAEVVVLKDALVALDEVCPESVPPTPAIQVAPEEEG